MWRCNNLCGLGEHMFWCLSRPFFFLSLCLRSRCAIARRPILTIYTSYDVLSRKDVRLGVRCWISLLTVLTVRNLNFKNPRWRTAANLKTVKSPVLRNLQHRNCLQGLDQNSLMATERTELSFGDICFKKFSLQTPAVAIALCICIRGVVLKKKWGDAWNKT